LSRYVSPTPVTERAIHMFQGIMSHHGGPHSAMLRAYGLVEGGLNRQAIVYSYVDDLRYMTVVCAICVPLLFLLKNVKPKGPVGMH
jgi:hypothetical protein